MQITILAASLCALMLVWLSVSVIARRYGAKVALGDGDDRLLRRRIRRHANFVEYTPLALIMIGATEYLGFSAWVVGPLAAAFVIGRLTHALGLGVTGGQSAGRTVGMLTTFAVLVLGALLAALGALTDLRF